MFDLNSGIKRFYCTAFSIYQLNRYHLQNLSVHPVLFHGFPGTHHNLYRTAFITVFSTTQLEQNLRINTIFKIKKGSAREGYLD